MNERTFNWDGDRIKETVKQEPKKHTPKDILEGLEGVRSQIAKFEDTIAQSKATIESTKKSLEQAVLFEKDLKQFEAKCIELQKESMKLIIKQIHEESVAEAKKSADTTIAKSPDAYTEQGKKNLPFLNYQRLLAVNKKMAEKISRSLIAKYLFEEPIFENPFKD